MGQRDDGQHGRRWPALLRHEEQATLLVQGVASLERARAASQAAYDKGAVSRLDVLQADTRLLHAADARAGANGIGPRGRGHLPDAAQH